MAKSEDTGYSKYLVCDCLDKEHMVYLQKFDWQDESGDCDFSIGVSKCHYRGFFSRCVLAFRYIFNINRQGFYSEIMLNDESASEIESFIADYRKYKENK